MSYEIFQVLHPWAYELDQVDLKYVMNNDVKYVILDKLENFDAKVFWISYFKP